MNAQGTLALKRLLVPELLGLVQSSEHFLDYMQGFFLLDLEGKYIIRFDVGKAPLVDYFLLNFFDFEAENHMLEESLSVNSGVNV